MEDLRWWRFWDRSQWVAWWQRRRIWREHHSRVRRLDAEIAAAAARLTEARTGVDQAGGPGSVADNAADAETWLRMVREERISLQTPPRPVSPALVPATIAVLVALGSISGGAEGPGSLPAPSATTNASSTSSTGSTTPAPATVPSPATTLLPRVDILLAPLTAGPSGDPLAPPPQGSVPVTVTGIVDGDTLEVRFESGETDSLRLIGVNSPEGGECYATEAALVLAAMTPPGSEVALTSDVTDRDDFGRLLRYVWVGGLSVNQELVRRGAAIARRYAPDLAMADAIEAAQASAREQGLGLWAPDACGPPADATLRIVEVTYDAPGDDNLNLNEEWVRIQNQGRNFVDMGGWVLKDESASHRFHFPTGFGLGPGETVTVHTGCGEPFSTTLFWCSVGSAIWNNDGDTAFLLDPNGNTHHQHGYTPPTTTTATPTTTTAVGDDGDCDPAYPTVCIPSPPPDLDCGEIGHRRFQVLPPDPHGFDRDNDGIGCES